MSRQAKPLTTEQINLYNMLKQCDERRRIRKQEIKQQVNQHLKSCNDSRTIDQLSEDELERIKRRLSRVAYRRKYPEKRRLEKHRYWERIKQHGGATAHTRAILIMSGKDPHRVKQEIYQREQLTLRYAVANVLKLLDQNHLGQAVEVRILRTQMDKMLPQEAV